MPIVMNTRPFQNPRSEPVAPTASSSGNDEKEGLTKEAKRLVVGAAHTDSRPMKKRSGMRTYCRNDRYGRRDDVRWRVAETEFLEAV
jgi:hypothetical protein